MIGFALEGGGAKGAYQAGSYMALIKNRIKPSIIAGTSIGALNAALMAQGDIKKLEYLWLNTTTDIFGINSDLVGKILSKKIDLKDLELTYENIKDIIKNKGIDTSKFLKIIKDNIDEDKLRKSKIKFALITIKLDGAFKPLELTIDQIPKGKVAEYILASCYLPIFKKKPIIDNNYYIDGGFYNNIPISILQDYGCDKIYSIRIKGIGFSRNKIKPSTKVIEIKPRKSLGQTIIFNKDSNRQNLYLGYYDTLKVIKNLDGFDYYFKGKCYKYYYNIIKNIDSNLIKKLKLRFRTNNTKDLVIKIVEYLLNKNDINKYDVYNIKLLLYKMKKKYLIKDKDLNNFIKGCKLI